MGATSGLMVGSQASQGVASIGNAYSQYTSATSQAGYQESMDNINSGLATMQAQDAEARGQASAAAEGTKTRQLVGTQRADYGAQGINVNTGSAAAVQGSANAIGALDQLTIKNNAARQAFGFQVQATNDTAEGKLAEIAGETKATSALVGGVQGTISSGLKGAYYYKEGLHVPDDGDDNLSDSQWNELLS